MKSKNKKTVRKVLSSFKFYEEAFDTGKIISVKDGVALNKWANEQIRVITSTFLAKRFILMGWLIDKLELYRNKKLNTFWKDISFLLKNMGDTISVHRCFKQSIYIKFLNVLFLAIIINSV